METPLRNIWRLTGMLCREQWLLAAAMMLLTLLQGLIPVAELLVIGHMVRHIAAFLAAGDTLLPVYAAVLLLMLLMLCRNGLQLLNDGLQDYLRDSLTGKWQKDIMQKAARMELAFFEHAEACQRLQRARAGLGVRLVNVFVTASHVVQLSITVLGLAITLSATHWALGLVSLLAMAPTLWLKLRNARQRYIHDYDVLTPARRRLAYLDRILTGKPFAQEVRLFRLTDDVLERWQEQQRQWKAESMANVVREIKGSLVSDVTVNMLFAAIALFLAWRIIGGEVGIGDFVMLLQVVTGLQARLEGWMTGIRQLYQDGLFSQQLLDFLDQPIEAVSTGGASFPAPLRQGISFEDVWFRYPGSTDWVLQGVSFHVKAGQSISLVGRNGAGKTTLVKLLLGMYKPVKGRITFDGMPLNEIKEDELRTNMTAIFQDFTKFELTLRESVGIGHIERLYDAERIQGAAAASEVHSFAEQLEHGYDTVLSRRFGGTELSGGQWQKVALARAVMRDAQVMILDEPTASLDPRAERDIFRKFRQLAAARTTVLISHRLGTARQADTILVMKHGRLIEQGHHDELVHADGEYSELFALQAQGYTTAKAGEADGQA